MSVFFICHGWRKWTESSHKILFQSRSLCDRNNNIGAKGLWDEALKQWNVFRWYSWLRDGRKLVDNDRGGRPKSTWTVVNAADVADLLKNDRPSWSSLQAVSKSVWHIPLLCVQWKAPDDGQRNCPKHVESHSKNKFEKFMGLVGLITRNTAYTFNKIRKWYHKNSIQPSLFWSLCVWPNQSSTAVESYINISYN